MALQIGHRTSIDFDLYNLKKFNPSKLFQRFQKQKPRGLLLNTIEEDTLTLEMEGVNISLFFYPYPLLKSFIVTEYLNIASLEDIAAMKLIAIIQRGIKRDFIDLYFLSEILGLEKIIKLAKKKYPGFNEYLAYQALVYFKDADKVQTRKIKLLKPLQWKEVKKYFISEVTKIKKEWQ